MTFGGQKSLDCLAPVIKMSKSIRSIKMSDMTVFHEINQMFKVVYIPVIFVRSIK